MELQGDTMSKRVFFSLLFFLSFVQPYEAGAFQKMMHSRISSVAVTNSMLSDPGLLQKIGISSPDDILNGKNIKQWVESGSVEEDNYLRSLNHFHNPLRSWPSAGLNDLLSGESSLIWAQDHKNEFSWRSARDNFYYALTSRSKSTRDSHFALTFKSLGQVIHLVQDCASPAHARNDAHPLRDSFESWTNEHQEIVTSIRPVFPIAGTQFSAYGFDPISQFFDSDQYAGNNPSIYTDQGLAEYTNANFASDDTIFAEASNPTDKHYHPLPRRADMEEYAVDVGEGYKRIYFRKIQNGELIEHFAAAGRLYLYLSFWPGLQRYCLVLDDRCNSDYAMRLVPRAVGYSAGLLNYFFRGNIAVVAAEDSEHEFQIVNDFCEDIEGVFEIFYTDDDLERVCVWRGSYALGAAQSGSNASPNFTFDNPPSDAEQSARFLVVFRGRLGSESNAVIAGRVGFCSAEFYVSITCNGITPKYPKRVKLVDADGREYVVSSSPEKPNMVGPFTDVKFPATIYLHCFGDGPNVLFDFWTRSTGPGCLYPNLYEIKCPQGTDGKTVRFLISPERKDGVCVRKVEWKKGPILDSIPEDGETYDFSGLKLLRYTFVHTKTWAPWPPLPSCLQEPHIEEINITRYVDYVSGKFPNDCYFSPHYSESICGAAPDCPGCPNSHRCFAYYVKDQYIVHNADPDNRFIASDPDGGNPVFNQVNISVNRFFEDYATTCCSCFWDETFFARKNFEVEEWEKHEFRMVDTPADHI